MYYFPKRLAAGLLLAALAGACLPSAAAAGLPSLRLPAEQAGFSWPFTRVEVESIEPGSYRSTMTVGSTQQLSPTVLPANASDRTVTFASGDSGIIQIGDNGLIGAAAVGSTYVSATAGGVTVYYDITVEPDPSTVVADMDLTISASELAVGDTANLSVSVSPSSAASYADVQFSSSNEAVATVNSFGRVTAVAKGSATISVRCGDIVRSVDITVTIPTDGIRLNANYLILKPGETARITGSVTPASAPQALRFTSNDTSVATVSGSGTVTAVAAGSTSIVVTNGDSSSMVTVIVNRGSSAASSGSDETETPGSDGSTAEADPLIERINTAEGDTLSLRQAEAPSLSSAVLDVLRRSGKTLEITGEGYTLTVRGSDIRNTQNTLDTSLTFAPSESEEGVEFTLNGGSALPGVVTLALTGSDNSGYTRLYLYNRAAEQWQYLDIYADGVITADTAGRYLLTNETLSFIQVSMYALIGAGLVLVAIVVVYIAVKKRYWFW